MIGVEPALCYANGGPGNRITLNMQYPVTAAAEGVIRIEGHAIVTADGMIADTDGETPPALRVDADWRAFQRALDAATVVVLGRLGHFRHPNPGRRRLVVTGSVSGLVGDSMDANSTLWNPAGLTFDEVRRSLGIAEGTVAVTGGTGVFDLFCGRFDAFVLSEVHAAVLPSGRPCFSAGHPRAVLAAAGLRPQRVELIDTDNGVTSTLWTRASGE